MSDLLDRFSAELKKFDINGKTVRVAVSGGADSIALLELLRQSTGDFKLTALHINHGIRGKAADEDSIFVEKFCSEREIPIENRKIDTISHATKTGIGIEETARELRYKIFDEFIGQGEIIATAHTAGDVVETTLFNLARGTGPSGLSGIPYSRDGIIRPLLDFWRVEIERWLVERNISWREDETNLDLRFTRNRVRHILIPQIKRVFGEGALENIRRTADIFTEEKKFLGASGDRLFSSALIANFEGGFVLESATSLETIWGFGEIIKRCVSSLGKGHSGLSFDLIARLHSFAKASRRGGRAPITDGIHLEADDEFLIVFSAERRPFEVPIELDKIVELPFDMGTLKASFEGSGVLVPYDAGKLILRIPRAGDRIDPEHKLKRVLAKSGVPRFLRDIVPVLFSDERPIYSPLAGSIAAQPGLYELRVQCEGAIKNIRDRISEQTV